jgi:hypothetical protein
MSTVKKIGKELRISLTAKEIRESAIDAAWAAAVNDDPSVAAEERPRRVTRDSKGGYTVSWHTV